MRATARPRLRRPLGRPPARPRGCAHNRRRPHRADIGVVDAVRADGVVHIRAGGFAAADLVLFVAGSAQGQHCDNQQRGREDASHGRQRTRHEKGAVVVLAKEAGVQ